MCASMLKSIKPSSVMNRDFSSENRVQKRRTEKLIFIKPHKLKHTWKMSYHGYYRIETHFSGKCKKEFQRWYNIDRQDFHSVRFLKTTYFIRKSLQIFLASFVQTYPEDNFIANVVNTYHEDYHLNYWC